jgi:hypothetical protein
MTPKAIAAVEAIVKENRHVTYLLTPWSRVLLEKLTILCS